MCTLATVLWLQIAIRGKVQEAPQTRKRYPLSAPLLSGIILGDPGRKHLAVVARNDLACIKIIKVHTHLLCYEEGMVSREGGNIDRAPNGPALDRLPCWPRLALDVLICG